MLNLVYTLPILTFFGLLVSAKDRHEVRGVVAGWNTPTSKNASCAILQKPLALMSRWASSFYVGCAVV